MASKHGSGKANDKSTRKTRERGNKTSFAQRQSIISWLDNKTNFDWIEGKSTDGLKMVIAGHKTSKDKAYEDLAAFVYQRCAGTLWSTKQCKSRYKAYKNLYRSVLYEWQNKGGTKFGLSDADRAMGMTCVKEKLEKLCPFFFEMDRLFGSRQNINPAFTMEGSDSEEEDEVPIEFSVPDESQPLIESQDQDADSETETTCGDEDEDAVHSIDQSINRIFENTTSENDAPVVFIRHEDGSKEIVHPAVSVVSENNSQGSISSLSCEVGLGGLAIDNGRPKLNKKTNKTVRVVDPKLAEVAAKACAEADGKTVLVGGSSHSKPTGKDSFAAKWSEGKAKQIEFEEKKFDWEKSIRAEEWLFTKDERSKRLGVEIGEFELKKAKFEYDKENSDKNAEREYSDKKDSRIDEMKKAMIVELVRAGKGPAEIKDYLSSIF